MRTDDKLDQMEERLPTDRVRPPRMTRTRLWLFWGTLAVYAAIVVGVLADTSLVTIDWQLMLFRPYKQWPEIHAFLDYFVVLGQRGPTAVAVAAWLGWRCWRQRNLHPLLVLGASLLLLNITVGAAKLGMGRLGPHYATTVGSNEMWLNGDIFPSGHTANAVVTWGVLAYLATTPLRRRTLSVIAALGALGVGMTTVYLGTHWVSDVLLGWAAGLLVLLAMPWLEPGITWVEDRLMGILLRLWLRLRPNSLRGPLPAGALASEVARQRIAPDGEVLVREAVGAATGGRTAHAPESWPHHPPRPHTSRAERTPVTPTGSRRPPHADRVPRGAAPFGPTAGRPRNGAG
ncbi:MULTISPECIES: phosphatase PAP2 family protein [Streptomyces]|uniref:Membrane-associated phospholipid phosphatase n=2 Tax=Streptomyces TaxID=1883 RepID=A0A9X8MW37_9ACTN|nr:MULTISPECIES: phosphatase PAP2 family protein [Streptomyces]SHM04332.1 Membrane-associated phospholipid phosphatase [Streptomyces yunnanensis]